ncbi:MAG TPA: single-stranded-DNA-specific exonuclease RecJ [Patescibacteria group bacterium]|nr:single-stranded-DNA-specific exonuclease RecJ [Patescibacteria group bacterium]
MNTNKKWEICNKSHISSLGSQKEIDQLISILLENRGLKTKKDQDTFLHPDIATVTPESIGIDKKHVTKTLQRIQKAIDNDEEIIIFGDYDVDGIAGTAILWETLNHKKAKVLPYIPSRIGEGYGLSVKSIENILQQYPRTKLIITVDNGIVANSAVDFANKNGIDVIITDHHLPSSILPKAQAIFHSTKLCGTGVAWVLSRLVDNFDNDHLALVALATVADLVPLQNANRAVLVAGLEILHATKRPGIAALCEEAKIEQAAIGVYEIGHMLGPRINAMGRISHAMDSLRLLCTKDRLKAKVLAEKLGLTNTDRQELTRDLSLYAITKAKNKKDRLLFLSDKKYDEGVIGLVAGKLVETYYRPSIVVAIGEKISKASARSVAGFNIIEFIRKAEHLLLNAGGHPMAAGFTVSTEKITLLENFLAEKIKDALSEGLLIRTLKIDCELPLSFVSQNVYDGLQQLSPFGMGNPEPCFVSKNVIIENVKTVGKDGLHLKLALRDEKKQVQMQAIAFGLGEMVKSLTTGKKVHIVYTVDENIWNNKKSLQLKIRDIQIT